MEYKELLRNRRSVRDYKDQPVPAGLLKEIIKESTLAPSSGNSQPWKLVIINNKEMIKRLSDESKKNIVARIEADPSDYLGKYLAGLKDPNFNVFYNASSLIIICGLRSYKKLLVDSALFAAYLMNAAAVRGLGTCWINLGSDIKDAGLLKELGIPGDVEIVAPIIVGYPKNIPPVPNREEPVILKTIG